MDLYEKSYYGSKESNLQFWNPNLIQKKSTCKFEIHDWTSMYNDYNDIPHYMKHLLLMKFIEPDLLEDILDLENIKFKEGMDD